MAYLIFIDTNIYLDYYRPDRSDVSISLLKKISANKDIIITTSEVEMEYKKNRQNAILESIKTIRPKDFGSISVPPIYKTQPLVRDIEVAKRRLSRIAEELKQRTSKLLESPELNDPVYQELEKLFRSESECHLNRKNAVRYTIRKLARKRFMLGYPPRKESDLSLVDAINWEWIIYCAQHKPVNIVIVSRDGDYGPSNAINDWLLQEFKDRISDDRSLVLTNSLTEAFKLASIRVTHREEQTEQSFLTKKLKEDAALQEAIRNSVIHSYRNYSNTLNKIESAQKSLRDYLRKRRSSPEDSSDI